MITDQVPGKIAFAGDWHMDERWATKAIRFAHKMGCDVILHVGDFGYTFDRRYTGSLNNTLDQYGMDLYFIDGNHEDHTFLAGLKKNADGTGHVEKRIHHLPRGYRWMWDKVRFLAMGGAVSVDKNMRVPMHSWWPGEEPTSQQVAGAMLGGIADVIISHDAPAGHMVPGIDDHEWSVFPEDLLRAANQNRELLARLYEPVKPDVWVHGHFHVRYSHRTPTCRIEGLDRDNSEMRLNVIVHTLDELRATALIEKGSE